MTEPKVAAADLVKLSREKGFLAKQLYVVFTKPANGMGPVMANIGPHLAFQKSLEDEGVMFAAGPHWSVVNSPTFWAVRTFSSTASSGCLARADRRPSGWR